VSRGTLELGHRTLLFVYRAFTLYGQSFQIVQLGLARIMSVLNPNEASSTGLGSSPFARRYLGNLT
jgi:hypothetical protein